MDFFVVLFGFGFVTLLIYFKNLEVLCLIQFTLVIPVLQGSQSGCNSQPPGPCHELPVWCGCIPAVCASSP